jgi:hypothetical protein
MLESCSELSRGASQVAHFVFMYTNRWESLVSVNSHSQENELKNNYHGISIACEASFACPRSDGRPWSRTAFSTSSQGSES